MSNCPPERRSNGGSDKQLEDIERHERIEAGAKRGTETDGWMREVREPDHSAAKNKRKAARHREQGREVAAIQSSLGEPPRNESSKRIRHQIAAGWSHQSKRALRKHGRRGEDRQPDDAEKQVDNLRRHAESCAKHGASEKHDHWLQRQRHWRKWQRDAELCSGGGERDKEGHGRQADSAPHPDASHGRGQQCSPNANRILHSARLYYWLSFRLKTRGEYFSISYEDSIDDCRQ